MSSPIRTRYGSDCSLVYIVVSTQNENRKGSGVSLEHGGERGTLKRYAGGSGSSSAVFGGGRLEIAQQMAAHESARTTGLYDRRSDEVSLDEVKRIGI
jgi:hypothetical protein